MEQTIGKRIAENRKHLGLTQDQLAERLGVTAQAVSKWENDQSCPDITTLPRLAEIFGTTTDALLGRETSEKVHQAEVVDSGKQVDDDSIVHIQNGNFDFSWGSQKRGALVFSLFVLLVGALALLNQIKAWGIPFWSILWPCAILMIGVASILHKKRLTMWGAVCTLGGLYCILQNLGIWKINIAGNLVFPILVVLLGIYLLIKVISAPKKPVFHFSRNRNKSGENETKEEFTSTEDSFYADLSFGESRRLITVSQLRFGEASCSFGHLVVDLSGCQAVTPGCRINADCSFGELQILVPKRFQVIHSASSSFAENTIIGKPDASPEGTITINADANFGSIKISYI